MDTIPVETRAKQQDLGPTLQSISGAMCDPVHALRDLVYHNSIYFTAYRLVLSRPSHWSSQVASLNENDGARVSSTTSEYTVLLVG